MENKIILEPSRLAHKDLLPTRAADRVVGWLDLLWLWLGMAAQMGVFLLGASFVGRLTFLQALAAVLIGNLGASVVLILVGDIGIEHGVNFATFIRAPFGTLGGYLPMIVRAVAAICWFGIQTYFGATAIDLIVKHFWGYSNTPLWFFIFAVIQIAITASGIRGIKVVENAAAPALLVLCLWVTGIFASRVGWTGLVTHPVKEPMPFWVAVTANLSYWSTVALNIPDFTRFVKAGERRRSFAGRNRHSMLGQALGAPLGMVVFALVGMVGKIATGFGNPVESIYAALPTAFFIVVGLVIILLAQLSTNVAANLFAPGYILNAIGAPRISFAGGVVIAGLLGMLTFPWVLIQFFLTYLPTLGALLAPVAGIMLSDYYLVRRRRLAAADLYRPGQFRYWHGINPAAAVAYAAAVVPALLALRYSWLIALPISLAAYVLAMRLWVLRRWPQAEVAAVAAGDRHLATTAGAEWEFTLR